MKPHEKVEQVYDWMISAGMSTAKVTLATCIAIYDHFGGLIVPDRVALENLIAQI